MGDLGVIALFADPGHATLPFHVYGLMGSYRMEAAQGAALLLLALSTYAPVSPATQQAAAAVES